MAVKSRASLKAENAADFPDNTARLISPADLRGQMDDIVDSAVFPEDGSAGGGANSSFLHPDLPSALPRPWVQRGREWCSPFDIITNQSDQDEILSGAGTFDATTQLKEAFAWAKRVEFPGGIQTKPCFFVHHVLPLQDDQILHGNGCRIIVPDAGWTLGSTDNFGLFQCKNKSRWRIEGFHIQYPPAMSAPHNSTPKAIYYENSTDGWVVGNLIEDCRVESIWGGGDILDAQRLHFNNNTFIGCGVGAVDGTYLPGLQMNCLDSEAVGNLFKHCGVGVGDCGPGNVVVGNGVEDAQFCGISLGDAYSGESTVVGNRIRLSSHPTTQRFGIVVDDGPSTPASGNLTTIEGNLIHLIGTFGHAMPLGIGIFSKLSSIGKNIITGEGQFGGLGVIERNAFPMQIDVDGLTVRALTETGTCRAFGANFSVAGVNVTMRLRNCLVEGLGGLQHFGYDTQTANFTVGATLSGASATATIVNQTDFSPTTGVLYFRNRVGTFTVGETITDSSGGSAHMSTVIVTSSYAYDVRATAPAIMNGTIDNCWKTGGYLRFGDVQYDTTYNNIPIQYGLGLLQNTATYDPASLAAGTVGVVQTMTVTGAALGDSVEATFSLDLQGIVLRAWVSAADTVKYQFSNPAGGATVDLGSGTVKCRVKK